MLSEHGLNWLIWEGVLPLLGACVLYFVVGAYRWLVSQDKANFSLPVKPAIDPLGWLYGAVIVATQTGSKGFSNTAATGTMPYWAYIGAVACLFALHAAMSERGRNPKWEPPVALQVFAGLMVGAILIVGYTTQALLHPEAAQ